MEVFQVIDNEYPSESLLEAALAYGDMGLHILPLHTAIDGRCSCGKANCAAPGKHPRIRSWQKEASTQSGEIRKWWRRWPEANIGIATGRASNLVVIDIDGEKGQNSLRLLCDAHGWQPDTLTVRTGHGMHLYFRCGQLAIKNSAGSLGEGVDVRGEGGYVVAPPSKHVSGVHYHWENPQRVMAEVPAWLTSATPGASLAAEVPAEDLRREQVNGCEARITEGFRNEALFKRACFLRGNGKTQDEIEESLMSMNQKQCVPPLPATEVVEIAKSAARYDVGPAKASRRGMKNPLWGFPLNINDWCKDTAIMLLADYQVGWLIWLMVESWKGAGCLTSDPEILAKLARARKPKQFYNEMGAVMGLFQLTEEGDSYVHPELRELWEEKCAKRLKNIEAGKESARSKYGRPAEAPVPLDD